MTATTKPPKLTSLIRQKLANFSRLSVRKGVWSVKRSYYWGGLTSNKGVDRLANDVIATLGPEFRVEIVNSANHWKAWPGDSHYRVDFKVAAVVPDDNASPQ